MNRTQKPNEDIEELQERVGVLEEELSTLKKTVRALQQAAATSKEVISDYMFAAVDREDDAEDTGGLDDRRERDPKMVARPHTGESWSRVARTARLS
jgi:DNA-binding protein H-NS